MKTGRLLILLMLAGSMAACHRYVSVPVATPAPTDPLELRVGTGTIVLHRPALLGDSMLTGWIRSSADRSVLPVSAELVEHGDSSLIRLRLPIRAWVQEFDAGGTALWTLALTALALAAGFLISLSHVGA